jgi:hypothetical protein
MIRSNYDLDWRFDDEKHMLKSIWRFTSFKKKYLYMEDKMFTPHEKQIDESSKILLTDTTWETIVNRSEASSETTWEIRSASLIKIKSLNVT